MSFCSGNCHDEMDRDVCGWPGSSVHTAPWSSRRPTPDTFTSSLLLSNSWRYGFTEDICVLGRRRVVWFECSALMAKLWCMLQPWNCWWLVMPRLDNIELRICAEVQFTNDVYFLTACPLLMHALPRRHCLPQDLLAALNSHIHV